MTARMLTIGLLALLLAGLTATAADAGEARKARGKVVQAEDEKKERGRYGRTAPSERSDRRAPVERDDRTAPRKSREMAKVPPRRTPAPRVEVRKAPVRRPVEVRKARVRRPVEVGKAPHRRPVEVRQPVHPVHPRHRVYPRHPVHPRQPFAVRRLHGHGPAMRWVPGHRETRVTKIWVPGHYKREKVPAVYGMRRTHLGDMIRFCIREETYRRVWVPGHHRKAREQVWVPGHWVRIGHCR